MQTLKEKNDFEILQKNIFEAHKNLLGLFNKKNPDIYIYGCGKFGDLVLNLCRENNIEPKGFIDTFSTAKETQGLKIFKPTEIENKNSLIIVSSLFYACDIVKMLKLLDLNNILSFLSLFIHFNKYLDELTVFGETLFDYVTDVISNNHKYLETLELLEDDTSKQTFKYMMNLREKLDYSKPFDLFKPIQNTYFEEELFSLGEDEVFLDGGGYTGDTTLKFIEKVKGKYKKIFLFEPCKENMAIANANLKQYQNIKFFEKGISNKNNSTSFEINSDKEGCHIKENGDTKIETVKIDSVIDEPVTFIKFDIESEEKNGLLGASHLLKKYSPKLAISAYHKPRDLWEIPQIIKQINPEYKIYFRSYWNSRETIFYAIKP